MFHSILKFPNVRSLRTNELSFTCELGILIKLALIYILIFFRLRYFPILFVCPHHNRLILFFSRLLRIILECSFNPLSLFIGSMKFIIYPNLLSFSMELVPHQLSFISIESIIWNKHTFSQHPLNNFPINTSSISIDQMPIPIYLSVPKLPLKDTWIIEAYFPIALRLTFLY